MRRALTFHLNRSGSTGHYTVDLYRWKDDKCETRRAARASFTAGDLPIDEIQRFFLEKRGESTDFRRYGTLLHGVLHRGEVARIWDEEIAAVEQATEEWEALSPAKKRKFPKPAGLRLYFVVNEPSLAPIPWELLRSESLLFLQEESPALRCEKCQMIVRDDMEVWPVRVLVIEGCSAEQSKDIKSTQEIDGIREALLPYDHLFDLAVIQTRSFSSTCPAELLRAKLREFRPHILHFIGHGRATGNQAVLEIYSGGTTYDWTTDQIGDAVKNMQGILRLAFVNACRSATPGDGDADSIASAFFKGKALSVIAMQADVRGEAAEICASEFYTTLAKGMPLDRALAAARSRLITRMGTERRDAFAPMLKVRALPEQILLCRPPHAAPPMDGAEMDSIRRFFVNRVKERNTARNALFETGLDVPRRSAVLITGQAEIGKTWLGKWLLYASASAGASAHRLDMFAMQDWLDVLLTLSEGQGVGDPFSRGLAASVRSPFYEQLYQIAGLAVPAGGGRPDLKLTDFGKRNDAHELAMAAFHSALYGAGTSDRERRPIVLAFDGFWRGDEGLSDAHFYNLQKYMWHKIALEPEGQLKVIVVLNHAERERYDVDFPSDLWQTVDLLEFPAAEVPQLLRDLVRAKFPQQMASLAKLSDLEMSDVSPKQLVTLCDLVAGMVKPKLAARSRG